MKVRLYRISDRENIAALATAREKETFKILTENEIKEKKSALFAEVETDSEGNFTFELDEKKDKYNGEPFVLDVYTEHVPGQPDSTAPRPTQFSITTLQPQWRQTENAIIAAWEYCIPTRLWCILRGLFGAWVICGRVVLCSDKRRGVGGVRVHAFDADWIQHDALGSAVTDSTGRFRIDYTTAQFTKTPFSWLNVELVSGPDVYFRIETTAGGVVLLNESPSRGRKPDRDNVGHCFCVDLCVEEAPGDGGQTPNEPLPVFTSIGGYDYTTDVNSAVPGNGLTAGSGRAFYNTLRLNGILSKKLNNNPMEYRFEVRTTDAIGTPTGAWTPIAPAQIARTIIGTWEQYAPAFPGDPNPIKTKRYTVNGVPGPNELVASFTADGWIKVPQESNVFGPSGYFQPNGNMINLVSQTLAAFGTVNLAGLEAGSSVTSTGQPLVQNRHFSFRMRVREAPIGGAGTDGGICHHVAINNTLYDNLNHHPSWAGWMQSSALGVGLLDIEQLTTNGCAGVTDALDVKFTAAHPTLGNVSITMSGPGGPYAFTLPAPVTPGQDHYGTAAPSGWAVTDLQPCAYIVRLSVQLLLTTGDSNPDNLYDDIAFCKK